MVVLGGEDAAVNLIKDLARSPQWRVVGVFDDDAPSSGRQIHGVNVLGRARRPAGAAARLGCPQAIIAMPEATHTARRRAVEICTRAGLRC